MNIGGGMEQNEMKAVMADAIRTYGTECQKWMAVEEMAELANALAKYRRGRATRSDIITEIADVRIMMEQMSIMFGETDVEDEIERKVLRLMNRLQERHNEEKA